MARAAEYDILTDPFLTTRSNHPLLSSLLGPRCVNQKSRNTIIKQPCAFSKTDKGYLLFAAALLLARLAAQARSKAAFMAGVSFLLGFFAGLADGAVPLIFAHLAS